MSPPTKTASETLEPTLRADARRNREAVLAAARKRFADEGAEAQMDDIARDAGVGVGTVYRHFPTKVELIDALIAQRFERIAGATEDAIPRAADEPWEAFRDYMHFCVEMQAKDRALSEAMGMQPLLMRAHAESSGTHALVAKLVERVKAAGALREDFEPDDVPMIICGLGRVIVAGSHAGEANWERFLAIILDGVRPQGTDELPAAVR